jgi:hypothetical protein
MIHLGILSSIITGDYSLYFFTQQQSTQFSLNTKNEPQFIEYLLQLCINLQGTPEQIQQRSRIFSELCVLYPRERNYLIEKIKQINELLPYQKEAFLCCVEKGY